MLVAAIFGRVRLNVLGFGHVLLVLERVVGGWPAAVGRRTCLAFSFINKRLICFWLAALRGAVVGTERRDPGWQFTRSGLSAKNACSYLVEGVDASFQVGALQPFEVSPCQAGGKVALQLRRRSFKLLKPIPEGPSLAVTDPLVAIQAQVLEGHQGSHSFPRENGQVVVKQIQGHHFPKVMKRPAVNQADSVLVQKQPVEVDEPPKDVLRQALDFVTMQKQVGEVCEIYEGVVQQVL